MSVILVFYRDQGTVTYYVGIWAVRDRSMRDRTRVADPDARKRAEAPQLAGARELSLEASGPGTSGPTLLPA